MKSKLFSIAMLLFGALMMTSCLSDDKNDQKQIFTYNQDLCFNAVTDIATNETRVETGTIYRITIDYTTAALTLEIQNLNLSEDLKGLSFKFENLKMVADSEGWLVASGRNLTSVGNSSLAFDNLSVKTMIRGNMYSFCIQYTVDSKYVVNVVPVQSLYFADTYVSPVGENQLGAFTTDETYYIVTLDPKTMKAVLAVAKAKFSDKMPLSLNFMIKDLPFEINPVGYSINATGNFTPLSETGVPNPKYPCSDIKITADIAKGGTLSYFCEPNNMGKFNVTATLKYVIKKQTGN